MKKIFTISMVLLLISTTNGQNARGLKTFLTSAFLNQNVYKTKENLKLVKVYSLDSNSIPSTFDTINLFVRNGNFIRYKIVSTGDNGCYIKILKGCNFNYGNDTILVNGSSERNYGPSRYYYKIEDENITPNKQYLATEHLTGLPLILPVKVRIDFTDDIVLNANINYSFGLKFKIGNNPYKQNYINIIPVVFGLGSEKYFKKDSLDKNTEKEDAVSFSYAFGATYEINKFNLGLFYGKDWMFGDKKDWVYQNKPWISIGIGYKIGE